MSDGISESSAKEIGQLIARRLRHVENLGQGLGLSIQDWLKETPPLLNSSIASDRLSWELRVSDVQPPIEKWEGSFNDAIHNLRSALDNLAWLLAHADGRIPSKPKQVQFPIALKPGDWSSDKRRIAELPVLARMAIQSVQPYQRVVSGDDPTHDSLFLLSLFDNAQKHRVVLSPVINPEELSHSFSVEFRSDEEAGMNVPPNVEINADIFVAGATVLKCHAVTPIVTVKGNFSATARVVVVHDTAGTFGATEVLGSLLQYVATVVNHTLVSSVL